jgi:Fe-Mn family superoxide dismutase
MFIPALTFQPPKNPKDPPKETTVAIELPALPYEMDALAPHISAETLDFHHGKHHQAYVTNLNGMIAETELADASLEEIISASEGGVFNNAAQIWNHTFYWNSMTPGGGGAPDGEVGEAINSAFGSYHAFRDEFTTAAKTQFGSGWAWLTDDGSGLSIMKTANADLPLAHSVKALLTIDVWEHAYYIDHRNARPAYIDAFMDNLLNWDHVAKLLA